MRHGIGERVRDRVRLMTGGERSWCPGLDRAWPASTRHGLDSARTRPFTTIKPGCCFICGELCVGVERIAETRTGFRNTRLPELDLSSRLYAALCGVFAWHLSCALLSAMYAPRFT